MKINDGGPAFPQPVVSTGSGIVSASGVNEGGLSLRDYFAAKALAGIIGGATGWVTCDYKPKAGLTIIENEARLAYQFADAMIKACQGSSND